MAVGQLTLTLTLTLAPTPTPTPTPNLHPNPNTQQDASLHQTDGDEKRAFAAPEAIRDELLRALPPGATLHTFVTDGGAPLCEQVRSIN